MPRVLAVCEADNVASARTLERAGGVLAQSDDGGRVRRYRLTPDRTGIKAQTVDRLASKCQSFSHD